MKTKKPSVTIGICAYNEASTIGPLLDSLLTQSEELAKIKEILVVIDGSTDGTEKIARARKNRRISVKRFSKREGKPARMNYVLRKFSGDILVFLDADVELGNERTIETLVTPIINEPTVGVVAGRGVPLDPETFVESAVSNYIFARLAVEHRYDFSLTPYVLHGMCMALSKGFAQTLVFPDTILSDDAYVYFTALRKGIAMKYAKNAKVYYRSPQTLSDAIEQAIRHHSCLPQLWEYFPRERIMEAYTLPSSLLATIGFYQWITNPLGYVLVKAINTYARIRAVSSYQTMDIRWKPISSSKQLHKAVANVR